jgi:hypothetical protein
MIRWVIFWYRLWKWKAGTPDVLGLIVAGVSPEDRQEIYQQYRDMRPRP